MFFLSYSGLGVILGRLRRFHEMLFFFFLAPQQQVIVPDSKLIPHMNASGMVRKAEVYTCVHCHYVSCFD